MLLLLRTQLGKMKRNLKQSFSRVPVVSKLPSLTERKRPAAMARRQKNSLKPCLFNGQSKFIATYLGETVLAVRSMFYM